MMASSILRTSKSFLCSAGIRNPPYLRWVSSSSNKKAEVHARKELSVNQRVVSHSKPELILDHQDGHRLTSRSKLFSQASRNGQLYEQPLRTSGGSINANDPLQHILNHPSASIILRDACKCSKCKDYSTTQRDFHLAQIPVDIKPASVEQDTRGNWIIRWQNDMPGWENHVSVFNPHEIERLKTHMEREHKTSTQLWDRKEYENNKFTVSYKDYMNSDAALAETLHHWSRYGVVFIKNVPEDAQSVVLLAQRIAPMKSTFYGPTWDIKSVPNATNVAFTNKYLGFHGDMLYLKEPPTAQFLHCIHNSATGGESRFVDQFKAFDTLCSEDMELATALAETKLRYEYENDGFYYTDIKPIVQWRTDSYQFPRRQIQGANNRELDNVYRMFWAPQFLGSIISDFGISKTTLEKSVAAMKKYADILEREELFYQEKMEEGTCVVFDNLRVLHARNEYDVNTGRRWLKGTYVDAQDMWSVELKLKDYTGHIKREAGVRM